jgi:hypothetical protein
MKIDEQTLTHMRGRQRPGTRWYAYQNKLLGGFNLGGHIVCLQVGEGCTHTEAPDKLPPGCVDLGVSQAYAYTLLGEVDLYTGEPRRLYGTSTGLQVPLEKMVRLEPDWAANRVREGEKAIKERDDLLAIIHRDGGHYQAKHGLAKAIEDVPIAIAARVEQELQSRLEYIRQELNKLIEWSDTYLNPGDRGAALARIRTILRTIPGVEVEEDPLESKAVRVYEASVAEAYEDDNDVG